MYVPIDTVAPLPEALNHSHPPSLGRRHRIGDHELDRTAFGQFNELLETLAFPQAPLAPDQIASAARELVDGSQHGFASRCIQQRMRRGAAIDLMVKDPDWELLDATTFRAGMAVVGYLRGNLGLIPRAAPVVGRLDDAIVMEAAWPSLVGEIRQYLAFCRLRHVEAILRGETRPHFGFTRDHWQEAARAELEWTAHCHRVAQDSYLLRERPPAFRVH